MCVLLAGREQVTEPKIGNSVAWWHLAPMDTLRHHRGLMEGEGMSFDAGTVLLRTGEGKTVPVAGTPYTFKATSGDTRGAYVAVEVTADGAPPPLHIHDNAEEAFYVLDGAVTM